MALVVSIEPQVSRVTAEYSLEEGPKGYKAAKRSGNAKGRIFSALKVSVGLF